MKYIVTCIIAILICGCGPSMTVDEFRMQNRENILKLSIGMSKQQALDVMESEDYNYYNISINNPYKSEILQGNDKIFEVIYYYTENKRPIHPFYGVTVAEDELTPLVFDEGELIGWGWSFLDQNLQKYEIRIR